MLKILLVNGLINSKICFLNIGYKSENLISWRMLGKSNLSHSINVEGKYLFLKK